MSSSLSVALSRLRAKALLRPSFMATFDAHVTFPIEMSFDADGLKSLTPDQLEARLGGILQATLQEWISGEECPMIHAASEVSVSVGLTGPQPASALDWGSFADDVVNTVMVFPNQDGSTVEQTQGAVSFLLDFMSQNEFSPLHEVRRSCETAAANSPWPKLWDNVREYLCAFIDHAVSAGQKKLSWFELRYMLDGLSQGVNAQTPLGYLRANVLCPSPSVNT